jgi:hypothetical protein
MEDFNGLASSLAAGVGDVRGCLIVSSDGLVLGAHPDDGEAQAKPAWVRFAALGDPERGFAQFGTETWCYVRRGPYAAFAVVGLGARPGLVIDHMEQVLLAAEETRNSREGVRAEAAPPAPAAAPSSKPRTTLHPERPLEEPVLIAADVAPVSAAETSADPSSTAVPPAPATGSVPPTKAEPDASAASPADGTKGSRGVTPDGEGTTLDDPDEVDRFSLEREFGQLLQDEQDGADG